MRTQAAKQSLPPEFKDALVMTVVEAKGLEFDSVSPSLRASEPQSLKA